MDLRKVKKILELMESSDVSEIEIKEGDESLRITRNVSMDRQTSSPQAVTARRNRSARKSFVRNAIAADRGASRTTESVRSITGRDQVSVEMDSIDGFVVGAPMVGTFYRAPAPDAQPFVEKGQQVKAGDVLCIIESMKMMNEIKAEADALLVDVLVENADSVEYNQPLFVLDLSSR